MVLDEQPTGSKNGGFLKTSQLHNCGFAYIWYPLMCQLDASEKRLIEENLLLRLFYTSGSLARSVHLMHTCNCVRQKLLV
jgi:hypothetical protein